MKSLKFGGFSHLFQLLFLIKYLFFVVGGAGRCAQWQMRMLPCMGQDPGAIGKESALLTEVQKGCGNAWQYWRWGKVVHPGF